MKMGVIITARWWHEKAVIVHRHCQFVSPADGDNHPIITDSYHQPAVKIIITKALYYKLAVITMVQHSKTNNFFKSSRMKMNFIWLFHLKLFRYSKILFHVHIFWKFNFFELSKRNSDEKMTKTRVVNLDEIYKFVVDDCFIWNHLWS